MGLTDSEVDDVLEAIASHFAAKLTGWEHDFIHNVTGQWEQRRSLSDKQRAKLADIWDGFRTGRRA